MLAGSGGNGVVGAPLSHRDVRRALVRLERTDRLTRRDLELGGGRVELRRRRLEDARRAQSENGEDDADGDQAADDQLIRETRGPAPALIRLTVLPLAFLPLAPLAPCLCHTSPEYRPRLTMT